jgi:benzoyl-CoA reductase/2-hydroxyglutaryl-CoA dehydratase subunit BcrC/BadD/HgdB
MPDDYRQMWTELGINLEAHDGLLQVLPPLFSDVFLSQKDRPARMSYFDYVFSEVHGLRIRELMNHKKNGGIVVGTYCTYAPEEIIMAANGISVGLCAGAEVAPEAALEFLPGNLCPLIKSSLGFKLAKVCPYIESCDLLIGETTCDGKKKFYEILGDMQPVHVMELPQKKNAADADLWKSEVSGLASVLEKVSGRQIEYASLAEAVKVVNEKRRALLRLAELRKSDPPVISGRDALLINQIAFNDDPRRFTVKLNELCDELDKRVASGKSSGGPARPRIMLSGCPMALPNWKLANVIETSGAAIVMEEMCTGVRYWRNLTDDSPEDIDGLLDATAERYFEIDCAVFTPNQERIDNILELVRDYDVDAVVYGALTACDPYTIEAYKVQKALMEADVPMLYIETDYGDDSQQIATRVQALLEMVAG